MEEQMIVRPIDTKPENCVRCHKKMIFRKPTAEEQRFERENLTRIYNANIARDHDVFAVSDTCECGQDGMVLYNVDMDSLK